MRHEQAAALATKIAAALAAELSDPEDRVFVATQTQQDAWVVHPEGEDPAFGDDSPVWASESTTRPGIWAVFRRGTDGSVFVFVDPEGDICFCAD